MTRMTDRREYFEKMNDDRRCYQCGELLYDEDNLTAAGRELCDACYDHYRRIPRCSCKNAADHHQPVQPATDGYMGKAVAAQYLGISKRTLDAWMREGLPHYKPGGPAGDVRFHRPELERWMSGHRVRTTDLDLDSIVDAVLTQKPKTG